ncbi:MAG: DUF4296 domain-containing protein [Bacteroidetes bacterium]|nr:DUF4296 domain-containing protein [Bacteroidota bacterium]
MMMRRQSLFVIILIILLGACKEKEVGHLSPAQMQGLLLDIHLAESYSMSLRPDSNHRSPEKNMDSLAVFYQSIFHKHHISDTEYRASLHWYREHPELLDSVYTNMIPTLTQMGAKYE